VVVVVVPAGAVPGATAEGAAGAVDACTSIMEELLPTFVAVVEIGAVDAGREVASRADAGAAWTVSTGVESGAGAVVLSCA
jgi:hypothetical protein